MSRATYARRVRKIKEVLGTRTITEVLLSPSEYKSRLEGAESHAPNTRCGWMETLLALFKHGRAALVSDHGEAEVAAARVEWQETFTRLKGAQEARCKQNELQSERQKENYVRLDELVARYRSWMTDRTEAERHDDPWDSQALLLMSFETHLPPKRSDLGALKVIRDDAEAERWEGNCVLLLPLLPLSEPSKSRLIIKRHKTSKSLGAIDEEMPMALVEDVEASLQRHPREHVFAGIRSKRELSNNTFTKRVQAVMMRLFGRKSGVILLRKAFATSRDHNGTSQAERERDARSMGHSYMTHVTYYKLKTGAEPGSPLVGGGGGVEALPRVVWRCEEEGCGCELLDVEVEAQERHALHHAAERGECGEDDDHEEAAPSLPAHYVRQGSGTEGCGAEHLDGRSCSRAYVCEHDPEEREDCTKRLVRFRGEVNGTVSFCPVEGCGARSRTGAAMRRHLEEHHAGELLCKCEDCGAAFRTCAALMAHVKDRRHFFVMADPKGHLADEVRVASVLRREGYSFTWNEEVPLPPGEGGKHRMRIVDFVIRTDMGGVVCVEVDDDAHRNKKLSEELDRMRDVARALGRGGARPVTFLRYNVHPYTLNKMTKLNPAKEKREAKLLEELRKAEAHTRPLSVVYLFYDVRYDEAEGRMLPAVMRKKGYPEEMKANCAGVVFNAGV